MTTSPSNTILFDFLAAPVNNRFQMALDPALAPTIAEYLGAEKFARYQDLARESVAAEHLALEAPNVIFVPGVMGSLLHSEGRAGVWWIDARTRGHIDDLRLSPDGDGDADPAFKIRPFSIDTTYEPFLAAVQATPDFSHRFFAYDWRKSLLRSADALRDAIRTAHEENGSKPVHLVGHSMGGLMIRATLMEYGETLWPIVGNIVFLGTPHYGSPAIASYLKHHFWGFELLVLLRRYLSRETFRSLWGVMELLPAPAGIYPGSVAIQADDEYRHPCVNFDLYDAAAWHLELTDGELDALQRVLNGARSFHERIRRHHLELDQEWRNRMAVIAGVGKKTLFRLAYRRGLSRAWGEMQKVTDREEGNPDWDGDGRVVVASAALEHVGTVRYVEGRHGDLPNLKPVIDDVLRWLRDQPMELPDSPEGALVDHLGTAAVEAGDDPGYLQLEDPSALRMTELEQQLEEGRLPEFVLVRPL